MTMNLFIPPLGTEITLAEPWTFGLFREHRNETLIDMLGVTYPDQSGISYWDRQQQSVEVTLPVGAKLKVDRFYIKKGQGDYDSVTFFLKGSARPGYTNTYRDYDGRERTYKVPKKPVRFWAKLADVNKIVMEDSHAPEV